MTVALVLPTSHLVEIASNMATCGNKRSKGTQDTGCLAAKMNAKLQAEKDDLAGDWIKLVPSLAEHLERVHNFRQDKESLVHYQRQINLLRLFYRRSDASMLKSQEAGIFLDSITAASTAEALFFKDLVTGFEKISKEGRINVDVVPEAEILYLHAALKNDDDYRHILFYKTPPNVSRQCHIH